MKLFIQTGFWSYLLIILLNQNIFPTDLCGLTSGTLTVAGSPYIVTCNVDVPDGTTLTIEPGVEIRFDDAWIFEVHGTLIAQGNAGNNILFTIDDISSGNWRQIYFNESENSILDYCVIEYAGSGTSNTAGINLYRSDPLISNTTVRKTSSRAIYLNESSPTINNCTITDNSGIGIEAIDVNSAPIITNTEISNNFDYSILMRGRNIKHIISVTLLNNIPNRIYVTEDDMDTGTWKNHNVPYEIHGSLLVTDGETLTIEPGCKLYFIGDYTFEISGKLIATGNINEPIIFSYEPGIPPHWGKFYFNNSDPGTILEYCQISNGGRNSGNTIAAVTMVNSSPTFNNVVIEKSETGGIVLSNSSPVLNAVNVKQNLGIGIRALDSNSDPLIDNFIIDDNADYAISMFADNIKNIGLGEIALNLKNSIRVDGETVYTGRWRNHSVLQSVPYVIVGNISVADGETLTLDPGLELRFNSDYVFEVNGALIAEGTENSHIIFTSNKESPQPGDWRHLSFPSSNPVTKLNYCEILYAGSNTAALNLTLSNFSINNTIVKYSEQRGIYLTQSSPTLRGCTIQDNLGIGIHIVSGRPDLGTVSDPGNNIFKKNSGWEVYNNTADTIYAQENFWVDTDSAVIDNNHIYDDDENSSKGIVLFTPYLKKIPTEVEEINETEILPSKFVLEQNYPNPFNPNTIISFSIPEVSFISLKIFNSLGEEIETLVAKELNAGNYNYDWNAENLTSGIYFYKLQADDPSANSGQGFVETKKMVLLK